jgi:hypothetical protein
MKVSSEHHIFHPLTSNKKGVESFNSLLHMTYSKFEMNAKSGLTAVK